MIEIIIYLVIVGAIIWFIQKYVPMPPAFKTAIYIIVVIVLLIWLLNALGLTSIDMPKMKD